MLSFIKWCMVDRLHGSTQILRIKDADGAVRREKVQWFKGPGPAGLHVEVCPWASHSWWANGARKDIIKRTIHTHVHLNARVMSDYRKGSELRPQHQVGTRCMLTFSICVLGKWVCLVVGHLRSFLCVPSGVPPLMHPLEQWWEMNIKVSNMDSMEITKCWHGFVAHNECSLWHMWDTQDSISWGTHLPAFYSHFTLIISCRQSVGIILIGVFFSIIFNL